MLNKEFLKIPEAREDNTDTEIAKSIGTTRREQGESMCHICLVKQSRNSVKKARQNQLYHLRLFNRPEENVEAVAPLQELSA